MDSLQSDRLSSGEKQKFPRKEKRKVDKYSNLSRITLLISFRPFRTRVTTVDVLNETRQTENDEGTSRWKVALV